MTDRLAGSQVLGRVGSGWVVSAANVVAEPPDLFETRLPRHLRGHCPHVVAHPLGGEGWAWRPGRPEEVFGWNFQVAGGPARWTFAELPLAARQAEAHLAAMDEVGLDAAVVFPLALLQGCRRLGPELARACMTVYNDWVGEAFESVAPARLLLPRVLPSPGDAWASARELERVLAAGARAVVLPELPVAARPGQDEVWAELAALGMTVCVVGPAAEASSARQLIDSYAGLRVVLVSSQMPPEGEVATAWLFDARSPGGAPMYCADIPRRRAVPPSDPAVAATNALRAFPFSRTPEPRVTRVRPRLPIPPLVLDPAPDASLPRVGLAVSNLVGTGPLTAASLAESARRIEQMGFAGIWVGDVVARRPNMRTLDPFVALGVAAGATEGLELGTCIVQVPLRPRVELAHRALSLHQLAPGRFTFGVGAGSTRADFDALGCRFDDRFRDLGEALPQLQALWRGERVGAAALYPSAEARGGPPVLIGSWGSAWVERAARRFDGWIGSGTRTWAELAAAVERFRAAGGRRAVVSSVFADLAAEGAPVADDDRVHLACSPVEAVARLRRLGQLGFSDVIVFNHGPVAPLAELARALGEQRSPPQVESRRSGG